MIGLWMGKLAAFALTLLGKNATSLPGKVALAVSGQILRKLGRQLDRVVVVTGTNGKTTTSALLGAMLQQEEKIVHNHEGSNMKQGLVTALLRASSPFGRLGAKTALLEIDEATLPLVAADLPIRVLLVTNVFRDQLDRYGELDATLQKLLDGIARTRDDTVLVLNADDPLARHIGLKSSRRTVYYGFGSAMARRDVREQMRDGAFCMACGSALSYDGFFLGQLGLYRCPSCDFCRPHPEFLGNVHGESLAVTQDTLPTVAYTLPVRGIYNAYNTLAAVTGARVCGLTTERIEAGLGSFCPPLGRSQPFRTNPPSVLNLIKNPTGCDGVLQSITALPGRRVLCIAINDQAADGRDVSWLWDADFELVAESRDVVWCITTGMRAEDMALRLKYAGFDGTHLEWEPDLRRALEKALSHARDMGGVPVEVITTYTALYETAHLLKELESGGRDEATQNRASVS